MPETTRTEEFLLQKADGWLGRVVGVAAAAVGAALLLAFVVSAVALAQGDLERSPGAWGFLATLALLGTFLVTSGLRMTFRRLNGHGSIAAPWVWFCLAVAFATLAAVCLALTLANPTADGARATASAALLALLAYGAGAHFRSRARKAAATRTGAPAP